MSEGLFCNFQKCRKNLTDHAYITFCSHAFCEEHGTGGIPGKMQRKCPACQNELVSSYDMVKSNLKPCEKFKSMVLAGLEPELIMEIANRALLFWSYQKHQEYLQQDLTIKSLKETLVTLTETKNAEVNNLTSEKETQKRRIKELEKDLEALRVKVHEVMEKMNEKTRENQRLQVFCETLKKKELTATVLGQPNQRNSRDCSMPQLGPMPLQASPTPEGRRIISRGQQQQSTFNFCPQINRTEYPSPKIFIEGGFRANHK